MAQDNSKIGAGTLEAGAPLVVTAERIASFCATVGEDNPLYVDPVAAQAGRYGGIVAPPAFVASFRYADDVFDQIPALGRGGLLGGIEIELDAPIRPGDSIRVGSSIKEMYEKTGRSGTILFVVVRSTLTNQRGEVVARVDHRMTRRL
jgi:acyl dehydratase